MEIKFDKKFIKLHNQTSAQLIDVKMIDLSEMNDNDFIMLCDQDDVWNADKISKTMHDMREQIVLYGNTIPLLVCTDVSVVDSKMNIIHESFRKMNHYNISHLDFAHLLMENKVQGFKNTISSVMIRILVYILSNS